MKYEVGTIYFASAHIPDLVMTVDFVQPNGYLVMSWSATSLQRTDVTGWKERPEQLEPFKFVKASKLHNILK